MGEQSISPPRLNATSVCGADGNPTISALANPNFYIDSGITPQLNSMYAGYTVRAGDSTEANLRLVLTGFEGDVITLATGQSSETTLPNLPAGSTHTAYFLLAASGPTTAPQEHTITLFSGTSIRCTRTFTFTRVNETIKALANKVDSVSQTSSGSPASLGDVITVTVEGRTGTVGAGPAFDPGVIAYAPTAINGFPVNAWRLERTELLIDPTGSTGSQSTFINRLYIPGARGPDRPYTVKYFFRAVGFTTVNAVVRPIQYIASGTQIKHTDVSGSATGTIPPPDGEADLTLSKTASPDNFAAVDGAAQGGDIVYTVVARNSGGASGSLDRIVDTLPSGITYKDTVNATINPGCTFDGDRARTVVPVAAAPTYTFQGPFTVAAGSCVTLRYTATVQAVAGTYTNSAVAFYGGAQIDSTAAIDDNAPATAPVRVARPASALDAVDDVFTAQAGTTKILDVLGNDARSDSVVLTIDRQSSSGVATVVGTTISYTPSATAGGEDTLVYRITDGELQDTATVTIRVPKAKWDQYVMEPPPNASSTRAITISAADGLLANDYCSKTTCIVKANSMTLGTVSGLDSPGGTLSGVGTDGSFTFTTLTSNKVGHVNFSYVLVDGDGNESSAEGRIYVTSRDLLRGSTPFATNISFSISNNSCSVDTSLGTCSRDANSITYSPRLGFAGVADFTYRATGKDGDVTVLVGLPAATLSTTYGTPVSRTFGSTAWITEFGSIGANTAELLCTNCVYAVTTSPSKGTASITNSATGAFTYTPNTGQQGSDSFFITTTEPTGLSVATQITVNIGPDAVDDSGLSVLAGNTLSFNVLSNDVYSTNGRITTNSSPATGVLTLVSASVGSYTYVNETDIGDVSFTYTITDDTGLTDEATVSIRVEGAVNDSATTFPGQAVNIPVRANDPCLDCTLSAVGTPTVGTAVINSNGTVTYIPPSTFSGIASFTYTVSKNGKSTSATVTVNVRPDAIDDAVGVRAGRTNDVQVLTNDICANCIVTAVGSVTAAGGAPMPAIASISDDETEVRLAVPADATTGQYTFTYTITDATGLTDTATVTAIVATSPTARDNAAITNAGTSVAIDVDDNDTCTNAPCVVEILADPATGVAVPTATTGTLQYTPRSGFTGTDSFTYLLTNSVGLTASATVTIYVQPISANDSAVVGTTGSVTIPVRDNDVCDGCSLAITTSPAAGAVVIDGDNIRFTTSSTPAGTYTFTYTLTESYGTLVSALGDASPTTTTTATVTVIVGDASPDYVATNHGQAVTKDVTVNDTCLAGGCTVTSLTQPASGGTAVIASGTSVTFTPSAGFQGLTAFTYTASYGGSTATATVTVLVAPAALAKNTNKNTSLVGNLQTDAPAFECSTCTFEVKTPPETGEITINPNGSYVYTPRTDWQGIDTLITYTITDTDSGLTRDGTLSVTVASEFPSLTITKTAGAVNTTIVGGASDTRVDAGDRLTYTYAVFNDGDYTITDITVTDDKIDNDAVNLVCPGGSNVIASLTAGSTIECQATYTITQADIDLGRVTNTATATGSGYVAPLDATLTATDDDSVTVLLGRSASMTVAKAAGGVVNKVGGSPTVEEAGDTITYTYTVTNTGNVTLSNLTVVDDKIDNDAVNLVCPGGSNVIASLAPSDRASCQATYTITAGDVATTPSQLSNTVTVTGSAPAGATNPAPASETITVLLNEPIGISLTKTAGLINSGVVGSSRVDAGDTVAYSFVVDNTSDSATLSNITITDPLIDPATIDCDASLAGNQNTISSLAFDAAPVTCSAELVITQAQIDAGQIVNTASVSGSFTKGTIIGTVGASATDTKALTQSLSLSVTNTWTSFTNTVVSPDDQTNDGDEAIFTYVVTNTGNTTLTGITVSAPSTTVSCASITSLAPGDTRSCTGTVTVTQANINAGSISNTVTASDGTRTASNSASQSITQVSTLSITNTFTSFTDSETPGNGRRDAGDIATFTYVITNTGNMALSNVAVTAADTTVSCATIASLAIGANETCTGSYVLTQANVNAGSVTNTATASSGSATASATATQSITQIQTLSVTNTWSSFDDTVVAPNDETNPGDTGTLTYVITNTGNVTLTAIAVSAPSTTVDCDPATGGNQTSIASLAPGATHTCTGSYTIANDDVTSAPASTTTLSNTVTATSGSATDSATATTTRLITETIVVIATNPSMTIAKTGVKDDTVVLPTTQTDAGDKITYTYTVTNTGDVELRNLTVTDNKIADANITCGVGGTNVISSLTPSASDTCTAVYTVTSGDVSTGSVTNLATLNAAAATGATNPTTETVSLTVNLTIARTLSVTNTFSSFTNTVVAPNTRTDAGDTATFSYVVTNTGNVEFTNVDVSAPSTTIDCDPTTDGNQATIASLAIGASHTCTGSVTLSQSHVDAGSISNTVTAQTSSGGSTISANATRSTSITQVVTLSVTNTWTSFDKEVVSPNDETNPGDNAVFTYVITNTGNVTLTTIAVSAPSTTVDCEPAVGGNQTSIASLAPGATHTCTGTYTLTSTDDANDSVSNTVTATAGVATDSATATKAETILTVTNPSMTIAKSGVKDDSVVTPNTQTDAGDTITYTYTVTNNGNVTLTSLTVTDDKISSSDIDCSGGPTNVIASLAPSSSDTCTAIYTVTSSDVTAGSVTNVATLAATAATGRNPSNTTVTLTVNLSSSAPPPTTPPPAAPACAVDDQVTVPMGAIVDIDVLANDSCTNITGVRIDPPGQGTTEIVDNKVRFTPDLTYMGTTTLIYDASNGSGSSSATITVQVAENWIRPNPEFYLDVNANSKRDPNEPGVIGVPTQLTLTSRVVMNVANGSPVTAASVQSLSVADMSSLSLMKQDALWNGGCLTDTDGRCTTGNVPIGVYWVQLDFSTLINQVRITEEPDDERDLGALSWPEGESMTRTVFGVAGLGALTGRVFIDANGNALFDTNERALPNRDVRIVWSGIDGQLGTGDDVVIIATTNQSGVYRIDNAPVGRYRIVGAFTPPSGIDMPRRQEARIKKEQTVQVDIPLGALRLRPPLVITTGSTLNDGVSLSVLPAVGTSDTTRFMLAGGFAFLLVGLGVTLRTRRRQSSR